jgi:hypothetical protein
LFKTDRLPLLFTGNFLLQNYKQALAYIQDLERELAVFESETGHSRDEFQGWIEEERHFFAVATKKEPLEQTLKVSYVEALEKLSSIRYALINILFYCTPNKTI